MDLANRSKGVKASSQFESIKTGVFVARGWKKGGFFQLEERSKGVSVRGWKKQNELGKRQEIHPIRSKSLNGIAFTQEMPTLLRSVANRLVPPDPALIQTSSKTRILTDPHNSMCRSTRDKRLPGRTGSMGSRQHPAAGTDLKKHQHRRFADV
jgi:hypothetical protein